MRKFGIMTLFFALMINIIGGCTPQEEYHSVNENVTITDARVSKLDTDNAGRYSSYVIYFEKDGSATKFRVSTALYEDVEKIIKTARMVNKEDDLRFDVVTDGKDIISVTLTTNRK